MKSAPKVQVPKNSIFSIPLFERYIWPEPPKVEPKPTPFCCNKIAMINNAETAICVQRSKLRIIY